MKIDKTIEVGDYVQIIASKRNVFSPKIRDGILKVLAVKDQKMTLLVKTEFFTFEAPTHVFEKVDDKFVFR
jgi:hypothetical protein